MSTEQLNPAEFTAGQTYARENLLDKVFKLDVDVAVSLIDQIEAQYYGTHSYEAGVRSYCHKLYDQLGVTTMNKRVETEEAFGIAGMNKKLQRAWDFAKEVHTGQVRKGTGGDYFDDHLVPVARAVSDFVTLHNPSMNQVITIRPVNMVCAALLLRQGTLDASECAALLDATRALALLMLRNLGRQGLGADLPDLNECLHAGRHAAALRFMEQQAHRHDLDAAAIARGAGCSRTRLYQVFAERDLSVAGHARDLRLAQLVRDEQDMSHRINTLQETLSRLASVPAAQRLDKIIADIRRDIPQLKNERKALRERINKDFPEYTNLISPIRAQPPAGAPQPGASEGEATSG